MDGIVAWAGDDELWFLADMDMDDWPYDPQRGNQLPDGRRIILTGSGYADAKLELEARPVQGRAGRGPGQAAGGAGRAGRLAQPGGEGMNSQQAHAVGRARHMLPGMERRLKAALAGLAKLDRKCMEARKMRPRHIRRGKRVLAAMLVLARDQRDPYHADTLRWLMGRPLNWRTSGKFDVRDLPRDPVHAPLRMRRIPAAAPWRGLRPVPGRPDDRVRARRLGLGTGPPPARADTGVQGPSRGRRMTAKQRPVPGDLAFRRGLSEAFARAVPVYFNGELLEGARRLPFGVSGDTAAFKRVVCAPFIRKNSADRMDPDEFMRRACCALFLQIVAGFGGVFRNPWMVPMFAMRPTMYGPTYSHAKMRWEFQVECLVNWVDPGDWPTAPLAFPETLP